MNWGASYAGASEDRPNERYFNLKQDFLGFDIVDAGGRFPYVTTDVTCTTEKWTVKEENGK
mgnify:CR=1 FL=1